MAFAIIQTGGKQYRIESGDSIKIEKLPVPEKGNEIVFDEVLLIDDGKTTTVGTPFIKGAKIKAEFVEEGRNKKLITVKFKNKINYRRQKNHRQPFTKVKIKEAK